MHDLECFDFSRKTAIRHAFCQKTNNYTRSQSEKMSIIFTALVLGICIFIAIGICRCEITRKAFGIMIICIGIGVLVYQCVAPKTSQTPEERMQYSLKLRSESKIYREIKRRNENNKSLIPWAIMMLGLYIFNNGKVTDNEKKDKKNGEKDDNGKKR